MADVSWMAVGTTLGEARQQGALSPEFQAATSLARLLCHRGDPPMPSPAFNQSTTALRRVSKRQI